MTDPVEEALGDTKEELKEFDRVKHVVKAAETLNSLEASVDSRIERFKDWYSLHFPELVEELDDEQLMSALERGVRREELEAFSSMAEGSKGSDLGDREAAILDEIRSSISWDLEHRDELEDYIERVVADEMPNLNVLLGPVLTAEMVGLAGGLKELARSPASTVQMLGAEKALFRSLRGNGSTPKHGRLYTHRFVKDLPEGSRGKMARFLANKAVMAARLDYYGDKDKGEQLREEAEEKFQELS